MDFSQMVDAAHRRPAPACTVAGIREPIALADQFGVIETAADGRRDRASSWRSRPTRRACPTAPTRCSPRWATTSSPPTRWSTRSTQRRRRRRLASTTWAATSSRCSSSRGEAGVYDFKDNDVPGLDRPRPRLLARRRDLDAYYDAHMDLVSVAPGLQPLQHRVADLHRLRPASRRRSSCTARTGSIGQARRLDRLAGVVISGGTGRAARCSRPRCHVALLAPRSPTAC